MRRRIEDEMFKVLAYSLDYSINKFCFGYKMNEGSGTASNTSMWSGLIKLRERHGVK